MYILTQNEVLWDIFFFVRITGWEQSYLIVISTGLSKFINISYSKNLRFEFQTTLKPNFHPT